MKIERRPRERQWPMKGIQLRQEPQGTSDFRFRSQGPFRLGTGESGLVLG